MKKSLLGSLKKPSYGKVKLKKYRCCGGIYNGEYIWLSSEGTIEFSVTDSKTGIKYKGYYDHTMCWVSTL